MKGLFLEGLVRSFERKSSTVKMVGLDLKVKGTPCPDKSRVF
jgi:hypothetical protein